MPGAASGSVEISRGRVARPARRSPDATGRPVVGRVVDEDDIEATRPSASLVSIERPVLSQRQTWVESMLSSMRIGSLPMKPAVTTTSTIQYRPGTSGSYRGCRRRLRPRSGNERVVGGLGEAVAVVEVDRERCAVEELIVIE